MNRFDVRLSNEGHLYLVFNCAVTILRITRGHELTSTVKNHDSEETLRKACEEVSKGLIHFLGNDLSSAELSYLHDQIIAQRISHQDAAQQKVLITMNWLNIFLIILTNCITMTYAVMKS